MAKEGMVVQVVVTAILVNVECMKMRMDVGTGDLVFVIGLVKVGHSIKPLHNLVGMHKQIEGLI